MSKILNHPIVNLDNLCKQYLVDSRLDTLLQIVVELFDSGLYSVLVSDVLKNIDVNEDDVAIALYAILLKWNGEFETSSSAEIKGLPAWLSLDNLLNGLGDSLKSERDKKDELCSALLSKNAIEIKSKSLSSLLNYPALKEHQIFFDACKYIDDAAVSFDSKCRAYSSGRTSEIEIVFDKYKDIIKFANQYNKILNTDLKKDLLNLYYKLSKSAALSPIQKMIIICRLNKLSEDKKFPFPDESIDFNGCFGLSYDEMFIINNEGFEDFGDAISEMFDVFNTEYTFDFNTRKISAHKPPYDSNEDDILEYDIDLILQLYLYSKWTDNYDSIPSAEEHEKNILHFLSKQLVDRPELISAIDYHTLKVFITQERFIGDNKLNDKAIGFALSPIILDGNGDVASDMLFNLSPYDTISFGLHEEDQAVYYRAETVAEMLGISLSCGKPELAVSFMIIGVKGHLTCVQFIKQVFDSDDDLLKLHHYKVMLKQIPHILNKYPEKAFRIGEMLNYTANELKIKDELLLNEQEVLVYLKDITKEYFPNQSAEIISIPVRLPEYPSELLLKALELNDDEKNAFECIKLSYSQYIGHSTTLKNANKEITPSVVSTAFSPILRFLEGKVKNIVHNNKSLKNKIIIRTNDSIGSILEYNLIPKLVESAAFKGLIKNSGKNTEYFQCRIGKFRNEASHNNHKIKLKDDEYEDFMKVVFCPLLRFLVDLINYKE